MVKEVRIPITLRFIETYICLSEPLIKALNDAQAPIEILFDGTNDIDQVLYDSVIQDNFAIDARIDTPKFFRNLNCSLVNLMLNDTLSFCPKELVNLIKSYISIADLALSEVLAIRDVEGASKHKYYSFEITLFSSTPRRR